MRATDRQAQMGQYIRSANRVSVAELSRNWGITEETVRRDLDKLEAQGLVTRVHGGAIWNEGIDRGGVHFLERQRHNVEAKRSIAVKAAELIRSRETIIADASTTVLEALRTVSEESGLTVVTNSSKICDGSIDVSFHLISTGGIYNRESLSFQGEPALETVRRYHVGLAVLSCKALDLGKGVMDSYESEAVVKRIMVAQADEVAILADHSKFDRAAFLRLMGFEDLSYIVTDKEPAPAWHDFCKERGISLIC